MKSYGIVRKIDCLGRISLPKEVRYSKSIKKNAPIEIFVDNDKIILKKYIPSCIFCNETNNIITYKEKVVCSNCLHEINQLAKKE